MAQLLVSKLLKMFILFRVAIFVAGVGNQENANEIVHNFQASSLEFLKSLISTQFESQLPMNIIFSSIPSETFENSYGKEYSSKMEDVLTEIGQFKYCKTITTYGAANSSGLAAIRSAENDRRHLSWISLSLILLVSTNFIPTPAFLKTLIRTDVDRNIIIPLASFFKMPGEEDNANSLILDPAFNRLKYKIQLETSLFKVNSTDSNNTTSNLTESIFGSIITSVCFYCDKGNPALIKILECSSDSGENLAEKFGQLGRQELFADYTKEFHGHTLRAMAGNGIPILNRFKTDPRTGELIPAGGFQTSVVLALQQKMNFTMSISLDSFGVPSATDELKFDGFIGKIQDELVDLGFGAAITVERFAAVHFFAPDSYQVMQFVTNLPGHKIKWAAIFRSFTVSSWILLLSTCFCAMLPAFVLISKYGYQICQGKRYARSARAIAIDGLGFIIRPILEQPFGKLQILRGTAGAILIIVWAFFSLIMGTAYKSILMRNMVSPITDTVPNTYEELAADQDYAIYLHFVGGALSKGIRASNSSVYREISKRLVMENDIITCIGYAFNKKAACLSYRDNIRGESNRHYSDRYGNLLVQIAPDTDFHLPISILSPKSAIYKESMNYHIKQHNDMGISERYVIDELKLALDEGQQGAKLNGRQDKLDLHGGKGNTLNLEHFLGVIALLGAGLFFSLVIFMFELLVAKFKGKRYSEMAGDKAPRLRNSRMFVSPNSNPIWVTRWAQSRARQTSSLLEQEFRHLQNHSLAQARIN